MSDDVATKQSIKYWLDWLQLTAHVCTVFALGALLLQIRNDSEASRVSRSLDYVNQLHQEPISSHREQLEAALAPFAGDFTDIISIGPAKRNELDAAIIYPAMERYNSQNGAGAAQLSIVQLTNFYDHMLLCRENGICDRGLIDSYMKPQLLEFWRNFETVILEARKSGTIALGKELECYTDISRCPKENLE